MRSTRLISCSMGAAAVCPTRSALAPAYRVLTLTVGGVMSGNGATGRPLSASSAARAMTMEMTNANFGRVRKNLDSGAWRCSGSWSGAIRPTRRPLAPWAHLDDGDELTREQQPIRIVEDRPHQHRPWLLGDLDDTHGRWLRCPPCQVPWPHPATSPRTMRWSLA